MRLLALSGFVPEHICDVVRFTQYHGERNLDHYCGYANDFISQAVRDDSFDGAVYPKSCDSSRIMTSYIENHGKYTYAINVPARQDEAAIDYFACTLKDFRASLEDYYNVEISDEMVKERTTLINVRNKALKEIYDNLAEYNYGDYLRMIHEMLQKPLDKQVCDAEKLGRLQDEKESENRKSVYVVGSFLANVKIADIIMDNGMKAVGDNLPESGRLACANEVGLNDDIYKSIAQSMLGSRLSPTQDNFDNIITADLAEIKRRNAEGVIFVTQKYCEPYDYLYSVYKKALDGQGVPSVKLTLSDTQDLGNASLSLEAFGTMI
jgi:benzoyl-CoA reductase/2-hydroxyglutaryl-CoA dehydratase subunit BcrC/BadD/HgdB